MSKLFKRQFGHRHWIVLIEMVKIHVWIIRFRLRMREIWLQEDLHVGPCNLTWSMGGLTDLPCQIRVRSCISTRNLYRLWLLLRQNIPTLYLWKATTDWGEHNRIKQLSFTFQTLNLSSNLHVVLLLISMTRDGILRLVGRPRACQWLLTHFIYEFYPSHFLEKD
jgi:hypothetical protein